MPKYVVIVESPAKSKTIKKYLGKDYEVLASYGHVRDLPNKSGSVETDNDFFMHYQTIERNSKHVTAIASAMKKADALLLATDPDREGEAISWHVQAILEEKKLLKDKPVQRVVFHEITKKAVQDAVANPRDISMDLVNAQQARRALDYLVGFNLSPLLWKKVRRGLSAGRVQSPALRLIVERELEIEAFIAQEYWTIAANLHHNSHPFSAKLTEYQNEKVEQFTFTNEDQAEAAKAWLKKEAKDELLVHKVEKKQRKRNPAAPFITSTLQQEAARKLGFTTRRTMQVAQQLYEGVDAGSEGNVGLITYMRTDSVNLSQDAVGEIRHYIKKHYGEEFLPDEPRQYVTKAKNAQEAHEAIRPTTILRHPDQMRAFLNDEQFKLYSLIWKRTLACQMIHATIDTVAVDFLCGDGARFRANGSTVAKPGFMRVYLEGKDDAKSDDGDEKLLPPMEVGDKVKVNDIVADQHFTEPPPRYSEASLVKALEERGIGRPSTYASIISTLQQREYATLESKRFHPSDVGRIVNKFLTEYFTQYVDYDFTANLEDELDAVSRGEKQWVPLLKEFWDPFIHKVKDIEENVKKSDVTNEKLDEKCPKCQGELMIRLGRTGRFIGCNNYPECDYTRSLNEEEGEQEEPEQVDRDCPDCGSPLVIKVGRYGKFIGCSGYPKCKHMESLNKPKDTGVKCPKCNKGNLLERKSRRGKTFFSCETYPKCDYATWNPPIAEPCPKCEWPVLTIKTTKRHGTQKVCPQKECDFAESVEEQQITTTTHDS